MNKSTQFKRFDRLQNCLICLNFQFADLSRLDELQGFIQETDFI